ncbi:MAG: hypothetical protein IPO57_10025 [Rhodocyclales bacterium]|nr:hypothetical protein [Rhodocyclales bacterium]
MMRTHSHSIWSGLITPSIVLWLVLTTLGFSGCQKAGKLEHEAGVSLVRAMRSAVCLSPQKDETSPCGARDARYEASAGHIFINIYGVADAKEIAELVDVVRQARERMNIHFRVTITFFNNLGDRKKITADTIGE